MYALLNIISIMLCIIEGHVMLIQSQNFQIHFLVVVIETGILKPELIFMFDITKYTFLWKVRQLPASGNI